MNIKEWLDQQKKLLEAGDTITRDEMVIKFLDSCGTMDDYQYPERIIGYEFGWRDAIASVRTEHARALKIIEKYREVFEGFADSRGTSAVIAEETLSYFPDDSEVAGE